MINSFTCIMHVPTCTVPSLVSQEKASGKDDSKVANAACTELLILWYIAAHVNNKKIQTSIEIEAKVGVAVIKIPKQEW